MRRALCISLVSALSLLGLGFSGYLIAGMGRMGGMGMMMQHGSMMQRGASPSNPSTGDSGAGVYASSCSMCHANGVAGAPAYGNKAAWAPRIAQGRELLYEHALHGYRSMPPKGGHMDLSDAQIEAAVDYMVKAGGGWGTR